MPHQWCMTIFWCSRGRSCTLGLTIAKNIRHFIKGIMILEMLRWDMAKNRLGITTLMFCSLFYFFLFLIMIILIQKNTYLHGNKKRNRIHKNSLNVPDSNLDISCFNLIVTKIKNSLKILIKLLTNRTKN